MAQGDLAYLDLTDVAKRIQSGDITSVAVTEAMLERIAALDGKLGAFALVTSEIALAQAARADAEIAAGTIRGPLHGAPIAVKDLCWMKGVPTAAGMTIYADFKPDEDATVVTRLQEAGAVILGKLQLTESAYADHHPAITPPKNPWNADYWPGASSSGSGSATAAGLCYGSLGSDTGGSIRFPSAANGLTGLKPTWGRVSRYGVFELAATLDHVGPMTRSARDAAAMLAAIAGADANDPTALQAPVPDYMAALDGGAEGLRIGYPAAWIAETADAKTKAVAEAALAVMKSLGAEVVEVVFPDISQAVQDWFPLCGAETAYCHRDTYPARKAEYGPALSGLIDLGRSISGLDYQRIVLNREDLRGRVNALMADLDVLLIPAMGFAAPTLAKMGSLGTDASLMNSLLGFTCPFDMTGHPTITLPGGFTEAGLPVAFQFVAGHCAEPVLLQAAEAFQQATDWHKRHPALG
ncbi:amidase [Acidisoma silvae]|uniref:Amidase n=1 Tax=Acidisoma silvae TaxID=2802396 RepID=A0A964DZJ1_9PROT|nr:amidase [Acidisoma silvae]MCB8876525.1 amidase [Acidisoma silvae]